MSIYDIGDDEALAERIADQEMVSAARKKRPQIACDRCTLGVMDAENPHLYGLCQCECHVTTPRKRRKGAGR